MTSSVRALGRKAKAHAFRVLAALIAVLLPLQGITGAMAAIQAPAHYHVRAVSPTRGVVAAHVQAPAHLHHASLTAALAPATAAVHADAAHRGEHQIEAEARGQSTRVGHHAHALADAGVVYLQGDPDRPDSSSTGKHAAADAALTGWWMPMRGAMGAQSLPHAYWHYQSHHGTPALRPPAAAGVHTA